MGADDTHHTTGAEAVLDRLRSTPPVRYAFGGFGPLVIAAVLLLAMIVLAPSIAPERVVERPVQSTDAEGER